MRNRISFAIAIAMALQSIGRARACCPAPPPGVQVVNADQTVIIIWDAKTQTEHFIRRASFKSAADSFGFLIPTPNQPVLDESGNEAFGHLQKLTEPETTKVPRPKTAMGCGCEKTDRSTEVTASRVTILDQKTVAGFNAVVLESDSAAALIDWLKTNGYAFTPAVEAWAKPYIELHWKITALKVAKSENGDASVVASALRMSFKTDRPLFPYREPESGASATALGAHSRLLRIYFLAESRYQGELTPQKTWTGRVAWANPLKADEKNKTLDLLKLPENTGPAECWLTEFEDPWPYATAPADLYFSPSADHSTLKRPPNIEYVSSNDAGDIVPCVMLLAVFAPRLLRKGSPRRPPAERDRAQSP